MVKIGDYGLSKFISCSRRSGQTESVGTVHYMAPEIANGRYGREIDIYALGIILFEMLTGHVPFEGESVGEVLMKHLTAEPDLTALAEPYRGIVERALAKDPDLRLKNVGELVALLPGGGDRCRHHRPRWSTSEPISQPAEPLRAGRHRCEPTQREGGGCAAERQQAAGGASGQRNVEEPIWKAIRETFLGRQLSSAISPLKRAFVLFALVVACFIYGGNGDLDRHDVG